MFFIIVRYMLGRFFAVYMHILHTCSTWKTGDGRKFEILEFWGLQDYINRVRMPSRICLGVAGLNK